MGRILKSFPMILLFLSILLWYSASAGAEEAPTDGTPVPVKIGSYGEVKWYQIQVTEDSTLRVQLYSIPDKDLGVRYQLFKQENGQPAAQPLDWVDIKEDGNIGSPPTDSMDRAFHVASGVYYIKLEGLSYDYLWVNRKGWSDAPFELRIGLVDYENNESYQKATLIQNDIAQQVQISAPNDKDWYKITVPKDETIRVQLKSIPDQELGVRYQLFKDINGQPAAQPLDQVDIKKNGYIGEPPTDSMDRSLQVTPGVYYIKLEGLKYDYSWVYRKGWSDTPFQLIVNTSDSENNQSHETATEIQDGVAQEVRISALNDREWFKINVPEDSTLRVQLNSIPDQDLGVKYQLFKDVDGQPSTEPLDQIDIKEDGYIGSPPIDSMDRAFHVASGVYYIKLEGLGYDYLWVNRKGWSDTPFSLLVFIVDRENNEDYQTAMEIRDGAAQQVQVSAPNDMDWYKITVADYGALRVRLNQVPDEDMGLKYELYKEQNGSLTSLPMDQWEMKKSINNEVADQMDRSVYVSPGNYYLKLVGIRYEIMIGQPYKGWSDQAFSLQAGVFDKINDDSVENAVGLKNEQEKEGYISYPGDLDWYQINVPHQGLMQVESLKSYTVYLEDSSGNLDEITGTGPIPVEQGKYYLKIGDEADTYWSTSPYHLKVTLRAYLYTDIGHNQVELSWEPLWEADSYTVMRKEGEGEFAAIQTLDGDQHAFVDDGISDYRNYQYMITAVGSLMNKSQTQLVVPNDLENLIYEEQKNITYSRKDWSDQVGLGIGEKFRFDPSGPYVYYLRDNALYRKEMNGSVEVKVADGIDSMEQYDVSPDGVILYALGNKLYQPDGSGVNQTELPTDQVEEITGVRWLVNSEQRIGYIYTAGDEQVLKFFDDQNYYSFGPELHFSPDGSMIIKPDTAGANDGTSEYYKTDLYLIGSDAKKIMEWEKESNGFMGHETRLVSVVWSPDGSRFALQTDEISYTFSALSGQRSYTTTTHVELFDHVGTKLKTLFTDYTSSSESGNYLQGVGDRLVLRSDNHFFVRDFSTGDGWTELSPPSNDVNQLVPIGEIVTKPPFTPDLNDDGIIDLFDMIQAAKKNPQQIEKVIPSYGNIQ